MVEQEEECRKIIEKKNYYDILGIDKTADEVQIKKAYRKLAIKFHPDKNKAKSAEEAFKKVNQAFSVLNDKTKRKNYDMFGTEQPGISTMPDDFNPFDIFEQFFSEFCGTDFSRFGGGSGHRGGTFNNGAGLFDIFTSGFGGNSFFSSMNTDGDFNPIEELFFGGKRHKERNNVNNNRKRETNSKKKDNQSKNDTERNHLIVQFLPLIVCILIYFIFPPMLRFLMHNLY